MSKDKVDIGKSGDSLFLSPNSDCTFIPSKKKLKTLAEIQAELEQFKTSAEKFEYLSGLSELSWDDCQDAWFASKKLIPEVAKELRLAADREKVLVEALRFYALNIDNNVPAHDALEKLGIEIREEDDQ